MATGVSGLDSLDLLDLLFDRQDGILRGVELGTAPGAWHGDGVSPPGAGVPSPPPPAPAGHPIPTPAAPVGTPGDGHPTVTGACVLAAWPGWR